VIGFVCTMAIIFCFRLIFLVQHIIRFGRDDCRGASFLTIVKLPILFCEIGLFSFSGVILLLVIDY
jgi:hypothetical protein